MSRPQIAPEVVVVGSYNLDVVFSVERLPAPGETCLGMGRITSPGGKGSNQALQAARCGAATAMIACIGEDAAGQSALEVWRQAGIDVSGVRRTAEAGTAMAAIFVDANGENCIVVDSAANALLGVADIEAARGLIAGAKLVVAQLETSVAATRAAFTLARASGARTVLNAAPAPEAIDAALLALTDVLVVNELEGLALTGLSQPSAIGAALIERVGEAVALTLGAQGAVLFARGRAPLSLAAHAVRTVDTTGAGDALTGAFCARLAAGDGLDEALRYGVAAAALACTVKGAAASFAPDAAIRERMGASRPTSAPP
ncbi:MAG TPA: ribokinase [Caulobacteraceae bacterium]|nr:ribokinase [Caulobacteraceae bacterium]